MSFLLVVARLRSLIFLNNCSFLFGFAHCLLSTLGYAILGISYCLVINIKLSHHFHLGTLFFYHLLNDLIKKIERVLGHCESFESAFGFLCSFQNAVVNCSLELH